MNSDRSSLKALVSRLDKTITFKQCHSQIYKDRTSKIYYFIQRNKKYLELADKIYIFFYFPVNYSRRVCKSTNKKILA